MLGEAAIAMKSISAAGKTMCGGGFSTNIIGQVAKGDIARTGSIKGEDAVQAFQSYMGIDRANHAKEADSSVAFAMYSTDKYMPPKYMPPTQGGYKTVTAVDGSKWYHQYAQPTVVKEPFMKENGEIQYKEHIEDKLPDAPKRKDRI